MPQRRNKSMVPTRPDRAFQEFAELAKRTRGAAGLTQPQLAKAAGVSPKTLIQIEEGRAVRWDAVARIAHALSRPVTDWLKMSGHEIEPTRIEDLLKDRRGPMSVPYPRHDLHEYYQNVAENLKLHGSALMCTAIMSPVPLADKKLSESMNTLLKNGMHMALLVPFPYADEQFASRRPALTGYYTSTYQWACKLAQILREMVPSAANRIHLFRTTTPGGATPLVSTPIRANELRPTFTKYSKNGALPARYEFGALLRLLDGRPDEWIEICTGEGTMSERAQEAFEPWQDFCLDILEAWSPVNGESKFDPEKLVGWGLTPR